MSTRVKAVGAACWLWAGGALAQDKDNPEEIAATLSSAGALGEISWGGRLFTGAALERSERSWVGDDGLAEQRPVSSFDFYVRQARLQLRYRAPARWLSAELDYDISEKKGLKDAYVQAKAGRFRLRVGQFKMPVWLTAMESLWNLPMADRGLFQELLRDTLQIAGRRPGAMVQWRGRGFLKPQLTAGVFQGSQLVDESSDERDFDLVERQPLGSQSAAARARITAGPTEIGAWYEHRLASPALLSTRHVWTAGMDVKVEQALPYGGVRAWAEGLAGANWYLLPTKPAGSGDATFVAVRTIVAYRLGGVHDLGVYLEPFLSGSLMDPDLEVVEDLVVNLTGGLNVGLWRRARFTLQVARDLAQRNFPRAMVLGANPNRTALFAQVGVAF